MHYYEKDASFKFDLLFYPTAMLHFVLELTR